MEDTQNNKKARFVVMEAYTQNNKRLPLDLVFSILLRLPEKSLVRFRCVSKSWLSLITGERFIKLYLETNKPTQNSHVWNSLILIGTNTMLTYDFSGAQIVSKLGNNRPNFLTMASFIGSTNGLICFIHSVKGFSLGVTMSLYNPTTQAYRVLPRLKRWGRGDSVSPSYFGFGYDYMSNDFKIVSVLPDTRPHIYRLRTNSWELITPNKLEFDENSLGRGYGKPSVFSNNALHWFFWTDIIGFNLSTEEFYALNLPKKKFRSWPHEDENYVYLTDLRGCLHLLFSRKRTIEIWVMKEYRVESSWTKLLRYKSEEVNNLFISTSPGIYFEPRLYAYSKDDQEILLIVDEYHMHFFSCHLQTREVNKVQDLRNLLGENPEGFNGMPWTCTFATCD